MDGGKRSEKDENKNGNWKLKEKSRKASKLMDLLLFGVMSRQLFKYHIKSRSSK